MNRFLVLALGCPGLCFAACPDLRLDNAWIREPPPGSAMAAVYLDLRNTGPEAITLTAWQAEGFATLVLHETYLDGDRSRMRLVEQLEVGAGETVHLAPGGMHLMLKLGGQSVQAGKEIGVTVSCGGTVLPVRATVRQDPP
jgi:copper(I)-binding protein